MTKINKLRTKHRNNMKIVRETEDEIKTSQRNIYTERNNPQRCK